MSISANSSQLWLDRAPGGWSLIMSPISFLFGRPCKVNQVDEKALQTFDFLGLPPDLQRRILVAVPLRGLAQLACMNKELRAVYLERVKQRDVAVASLLESHFPAEFREGLSPAATALPRDLIGVPSMSSLLQAAPDKCLSSAQFWRSLEQEYRGFCIAGIPDGRGMWRGSPGNTYMGDWHKGYYQGHGTHVFADGRMYVGEWHKGKQQGQGTSTYANGVVYVGEWYNGKQQGQGTKSWANGDKYEGAFLSNDIHGKGRLEWSTGQVYVGEWVSNKRHGRGHYKWPNGEVYVGEYVRDNRQGKGRYEGADGAVYVGEWVSNKTHGKGHQTFASGESYFGGFKNDKADGQGIVTYPDARTSYVGCWKKGKIVEGGFILE